MTRATRRMRIRATARLAIAGTILLATITSATPVMAIGASPCDEQTPPATAGVYELSTPGHLTWLRTHAWNTTRLTNDIDMIACPWTSGIASFSGSIDGNGHAIRNLALTQTGGSMSKLGLFAVSSGQIANLTLSNAAVSFSAAGKIDWSGLLIGEMSGGSVTNVLINGGSQLTVTNSGGESADLGLIGVVGVGSPATITDLQSDASITLTTTGRFWHVGGIFGYFGSQTTASRVAGLGDVRVTLSSPSGTSDSVGGVIGFGAGGAISQSYETGTMTVTGATAFNNLGDFAGLIAGTATDVYATGSVHSGATSGSSAGGLIGTLLSGSLTRGYARGAVDVTGTWSSVGGLVGGSAGTITDSFWNPTDAGAAATAGFGTQATAVAMRTAALYDGAGWAIVAGWQPTGSTWGACSAVNGGSPFLLWQFTESPCRPTAGDPASWLSVRQALPMPASGDCLDVADADVSWGTGLQGGWVRGWEPWVGKPGIGGWACVRTLVHRGVMWTIDS